MLIMLVARQKVERDKRNGDGISNGFRVFVRQHRSRRLEARYELYLLLLAAG